MFWFSTPYNWDLSANLGPLCEFSVVIVAILSMLFFGERICWQRGLGISALTLGVVLIRIGVRDRGRRRTSNRAIQS